MDNDDILKEIRGRFYEAYEAASPGYDEMLDDLRFVNGENQWPEETERDRLADGRPCLVINKLAAFSDQVMGDLRMNSPSIKVKPVDSDADPDTAEVLTGLIRNIEVQSNAEIAYDTAAESTVQCGKGNFRIGTKYAGHDVFDQDVIIQRIKNPFTVYWDPAAQEWDMSDAKYCFVTEKISRDEFKRLYPKAAFHEFDKSKDKNYDWGDDKSIRIAEYWKVVDEKKTLHLLRNPETGETSVHEEAFEYMEVVNTRQVDSHKIEWYKASGSEILEGPTDWPGRYIPIIEVSGKEINIEGRTIKRGITRHAKDPARLYNYSRSHNAEVTSLAPKAPYLVTSGMIKNYKALWDKAHKKNFPYLPFEPDDKFPGQYPHREPPISVNSGILAEIQISDQEMHDTTGLQLASMGKASNEKSGKAIVERKREGDIANFAFGDNLGRAIRYAGKVLVDLIPKIYDTERIIRILGDDGTEEMVQLNKPFKDEKSGKERIHDLTVGKYDVVVTVGPSYSTQREEAAEGMIALFGNLPDQAKMVITDLIVKNLDWPGADELEKRLKSLLPPGLAEPGGPPPPPPPPDPLQELEMEKMKADVAKVLLEHQITQAKIDKLLIENRILRDEATEKEFMPDDILARKTEAEIEKLLADAKNAAYPKPSK